MVFEEERKRMVNERIMAIILNSNNDIRSFFKIFTICHVFFKCVLDIHSFNLCKIQWR